MIRDLAFWRLWAWLSDERRCLWCSRTFAEPWVRYDVEEGIILSGDVAFHWQDTHGFDQETLAAMVRRYLFMSLPPAVDA